MATNGGLEDLKRWVPATTTSFDVSMLQQQEHKSSTSTIVGTGDTGEASRMLCCCSMGMGNVSRVMCGRGWSVTNLT